MGGNHYRTDEERKSTATLEVFSTIGSNKRLPIPVLNENVKVDLINQDKFNQASFNHNIQQHGQLTQQQMQQKSKINSNAQMITS